MIKEKYKNLNKVKLGKVTTPWNGKTRYENKHKGIDIANAPGTPIPAFEGGKVIGVKPGQKPGDNGYGNSILIRDKFGNTHRYSHLKDILVKPGEEVPKKKVIATMGDTGSAYSPTSNKPGAGTHLDIRIVDAFGRYKNPSKYLKGYV